MFSDLKKLKRIKAPLEVILKNRSLGFYVFERVRYAVCHLFYHFWSEGYGAECLWSLKKPFWTHKLPWISKMSSNCNWFITACGSGSNFAFLNQFTFWQELLHWQLRIFASGSYSKLRLFFELECRWIIMVKRSLYIKTEAEFPFYHFKWEMLSSANIFISMLFPAKKIWNFFLNPIWLFKIICGKSVANGFQNYLTK